MNWQAFLLLWFVALGAQALWQRSYAQKSSLPATFPPAMAYLGAVLPLGIVVGSLSPHHVHWSAWAMVLLATEGIFIALFNYFLFVAIKRLPLAQFQMILQSYEVVVIALGWILLHEKLTTPQLLGGTLLLVSALLATQAPRSRNKQAGIKHPVTAIIVALLAAITLGIGLVTEKAALHYMDIGAYFIFGFATQALALLALAVKDMSKQNLQALKPHDVRRSLIMGVLGASVGFTYIAALRLSNNISLVTALGAFSLPLIVVASFVVLKERENVRLMLIATALGCAGVAISAL